MLSISNCLQNIKNRGKKDDPLPIYKKPTQKKQHDTKKIIIKPKQTETKKS